MKILVDMNLSPKWVDMLAGAGFEAVHWSDIGAGDAPDSHLIRWSAEGGYVVLTCDLDFGAILATTQRRRPSVVQIRGENLDPQAIGAAVVIAIQQTHQELTEGAIVTVETARTRLRILPLLD